MLRSISDIALAICCGIFMTLSIPARCQDPMQSTPTASPPTILPDQDLQSPRITVATFLSAMDPTDGQLALDRAAKTLDLSEIPELVREGRVEEVAVKLYAILEHIGFTPGKAPTSSSVDAIQISEVAGYGIYLERSGPNWRFSKSTVAEVPNIFREIEAKLSKKDMRTLAGASNTWLTVRTYVPEALKNKTVLIEDWQWIAALFAVLALFLIHKAVLQVFRWIITATLAPRLGLPPNLNLHPLGRPVGLVILTTALQLFLCTIDLPLEVHSTAVAWISTIRIVALAVLGIYLVEIVGERLNYRAHKSRSTVDDILYPLVQKAAWLLVILLAITQILSVHGVNVSGLVAGLGLGGLAFALAAKDTIENIFGSVAILIDQPFRVGDAINVGGVAGTVEQIGLRSTRLRTPDNSLVSMPNSKVIASHVDNLGARPHVRTRVILNLSYDTPPEVVESICAGIRRLVTSHPKCKADSVIVVLNEFNANSLGVLVQFHLHTKDWVAEQESKDQIFRAILSLLGRLQVKLTAPPYEVKMTDSETHETGVTQETTPQTAVSIADELAINWKRRA